MFKFAVFSLIFITELFSAGIEEASKYQNNSGFQWNCAINSIQKAQWKGNESILDIGCGDGKITAFLSKEITQSSVIGLDVSEKMIDLASSLFLPGEYKNLCFIKGDALSLPFENKFDMVVSFYTLHWVEKSKKALTSSF